MKLAILTVPIFLQALLLTQCGYFQPVNGQSIAPTASGFISTSPIVETNSSFSNNSSIYVTPSFSLQQSSSLELVEMSPSSDFDILSTSSIIDSPPSSTLNTVSLQSTGFSAASSWNFSDMITKSDIIDSSPYPASSDVSSIASTSSIDADSTIEIPSSSFDDTNMISMASATWPPSISPTQTIATDFSTRHLVTTDYITADSISTGSDSTESIPTDSDSTESIPTDSDSTESIPTDSDSTESTLTDSTPTHPAPTDISDKTTNSVSKNLESTTDIPPIENHTLKSSMSKSSKVAAGICIPLAIIAILGLTYFFYRRRRNQDRSVKFTDGGSTWSYANASFADDAVKSSAQ